ncbi:MAG: hypothetical protein IMW90_03085 [Thermogemmatispora sp.]|uniref:hypothetical protein n=1 Tax=Thermogemmatispora sp. TaxID=1968838 RepID=UPI0019EA63E0|nr:hypothetical protein [Thermogemmatispora sp.]MBE3564692.1 hypothetical protein [Thermogemmatispora sp.]
MSTPLLPFVPPPEGLLRLPQALLEHLEQPEWGQAHLRLHIGGGKIYWGVSQNETDIVYAVTDLPAWLACTECPQTLEGRVLAYKAKTSGKERAGTTLLAEWKDGLLLLQGQAPLLVAPSPLLAALQEAAECRARAETIEAGYLPWQLFEPPREWLYWPGHGLAAVVPPQPSEASTSEMLLFVASGTGRDASGAVPAQVPHAGAGDKPQAPPLLAFAYPPELAPFFMDMIVVRLQEEEEQEQEVRILVAGRGIRGRGEEAHSYVLTPARLIPTLTQIQDAPAGTLHVEAAMQDVLAPPIAEAQINTPDFLAAGFDALASRFDYAPVDVCFFRHTVRFRTITTEETARLRQLDEEEALCMATAEEGDLSLILEASAPCLEGSTPRDGQDQEQDEPRGAPMAQGVLKASQIAAVLAPFAAAPSPIVIGMGRRTFFARSDQLFFIVPLCSCSLS